MCCLTHFSVLSYFKIVPNSNAIGSFFIASGIKMNNSKTVKNQRCSANYGCIKGQVPHTARCIITELEMQRYQALLCDLYIKYMPHEKILKQRSIDSWTISL